jgi:uncharacterized protein (TIGR02145 family)
MVHDSIPATTNPYNKAHIGQTVSVTVITRLAAPIKLTANTPIVAGTLNLTCQPPASAGPNDNIFNWTGPNNFSATGQNVSIPNVTRAAVGNYFVTITNSVTRAISVPASIYANVNYSNSGCGGITHVYANGILYNLINIGNQCWFQTNLQIGSNPLLTWSQATAETTPTGIAPGQGACPTGYHLPTDSMLQSLAANSAVGFNSYNLDAKDANPCKNQFGVDTCANRNGNNSTGFSAQLSIALAADTAGIFWSVTDGGSPTTARMMQLVSDNNSITFTNALKTNTYNVRCLKD